MELSSCHSTKTQFVVYEEEPQPAGYYVAEKNLMPFYRFFSWKRGEIISVNWELHMPRLALSLSLGGGEIFEGMEIHTVVLSQHSLPFCLLVLSQLAQKNPCFSAAPLKQLNSLKVNEEV